MIRVGIAGYGNLGRGAEQAIAENPDLELAAVFTRRDPKGLKIKTPQASVCRLEDAFEMTDQIDVMLVCGGSATDMPLLTPRLARCFNVVDSFDVHANIPQHFAAVDAAARQGGHTAVVSAGWDPGLFSVMRLYMGAILPQTASYTFWGRGVSQGHSDAVRRLEGVKDARQYTVPVAQALEQVRQGGQPQLSAGEKHTRECYVVAEPGADLDRIRQDILTMPHYFDEYRTTVRFISEEEMARDHSALPHGGFVLHSGGCSGGAVQSMEFSLELGSNPEFTAGILACCARAAWRFSREGGCGAMTMADIPPAYLYPASADYLRSQLL